MKAKEQQPSSEYSDIYQVGKNGNTYHRPDGKFLSAHEKEQIEAHADIIRDGMEEYHRAQEPSAVPQPALDDLIAQVEARLAAPFLAQGEMAIAPTTIARALEVVNGVESDEETKLVLLKALQRMQQEIESPIDGSVTPLQNESSENVTPLQNERSTEADITTIMRESGGKLTREEAKQILGKLRGEQPADSEQAPGVPAQPELVASEELEQTLEAARLGYAKETAKDRKRFWGRFLQSESSFFSRFIKKIPGASRVAGFINEKFTAHEEMDAARLAYEEASRARVIAIESGLRQEAEAALAELEENNDEHTEEEKQSIKEQYSEATLRAKQFALFSAEDAQLEAAIVAQRNAQGGKANRFTNWWTRQKGVMGYVKKAGVVLGAGFAVGATIATGGLLFGVTMPVIASVASVAGGAVGGGIGLHVNNRRANSFVDKDKTVTVSQQDSVRDQTAKKEELDRQKSNTDWSAKVTGEQKASVADVLTNVIVSGTEKSTAETLKKNRNRLKTTIALGALGARLGAGAVGEIGKLIAESSQPSPVSTGTGNKPNFGDFQKDHGDPSLVEPGSSGTEVPTTEVEHSFGLVDINTNGAPEHAITELAKNAGHNLSGSEASTMLRDLYAQFGDGAFTDAAGNPVDLTNFGGDIGIGYQEWDKDMAIQLSEEAAKWLSNRLG